jgi:hypothetical protein
MSWQNVNGRKTSLFSSEENIYAELFGLPPQKQGFPGLHSLPQVRDADYA